ncbi:helix-turn-helix transcriptional regulator [Cohnella endophytica]|nr:AraC family transcriptional regulator [Cohnella endophytica]
MRKDLWENTQLADKAFPFNVFHTRFQEQDFLQLHWHEHFEMILVERGFATLHIGGKPFDAKAGDVFLINSGELHAIYQPGDSFTFYAIVFHPSLIGLQTSDLLETDLVSSYSNGNRAFVNRPDPNDAHFALFLQTLNSLIMEFQLKETGYEQAVKALVRLLFTWSLRWYAMELYPDNQMGAYKQKAARFKDLLRHIEVHYANKITLEQAASIVHLSPYHFCKAFKKMTGLTFVQFVNQYRVQEAEKLLRNTSLSVTEIADRIGCASINGFSKLFKQHRGMSPNKLRTAEQPPR